MTTDKSSTFDPSVIDTILLQAKYADVFWQLAAIPHYRTRAAVNPP